MKRRRIIWISVLLVVFALGFLLVPRGPREPVHQGKTITRWIHDANDVGIFEQSDETKAAMIAFGTNALPFLLSEFTRPISRWRSQLSTLGRKLPLIQIRLRADEDRIQFAGRGLELLETNAAPALPVLIPYLDDPLRGYYAMKALQNAGDAALPYLLAAAGAPNPHTVSNVVPLLQRFASRPGPARDALAVALRHPDAGVRTVAVWAWSHALWSSDNVVPDLLNMAKDPSPHVVREASNQLARLSKYSTPAINEAAAAALLTLQANALPPPPR